MSRINQLVESYGFIFIQGDRVLLIQGRNSYSHGSLIGGNNWYSERYLNKAFVDGMTLSEKKARLEDVDLDGFRAAHAIAYKKKLERMGYLRANKFVADSLATYAETFESIKGIMQESYNAGIDGALPWGFPKGRLRHEEKTGNRRRDEINAAKRESYEEAKIEESMYRVELFDPFIIEYADLGINYRFVLYFATPNRTFKFYIDDTDDEQMGEVSQIKWLSKRELAGMKIEPITRMHILGNLDRIFASYTRQSNRYVRDADMLQNAVFVPQNNIHVHYGSSYRRYEEKSDRNVEDWFSRRQSQSQSSSQGQSQSQSSSQGLTTPRQVKKITLRKN